MIRCLVVDDEPLARNILVNHIQRFDNLSLIKACANALEAFEVIGKTEVDLMFLDIKMPSLNGIDFIKVLKNPPPVVFTTAYSEFAVDSYELDAIDYLLKPITFDRFEKSIHKFLKQTAPTETEQPYTYFKVDGRLMRIEHKDIIYVQSIKDYLLIHTTQGSHITHMTMKYIADLLPPNMFSRVHRSYLVGIGYISTLGATRMSLGDVEIPIGDSFRGDLNLLRLKIAKI